MNERDGQVRDIDARRDVITASVTDDAPAADEKERGDFLCRRLKRAGGCFRGGKKFRVKTRTARIA